MKSTSWPAGLSLTMLAWAALGTLQANAQHARLIVDWGHDWGVGWYRERPEAITGVRDAFPERDLDGDGRVSNDASQGWALDWENPLSPLTSRYDRTLPNNKFYGGAVVRVAGIAGERSRSPSEGHINQNHELRDDWNLMAMPSVQQHPEQESYAAAGLWMWKKEDFLNDGHRVQVSFRADDYLAVFVSRYYGGLDWIRWVVRNGETFYVSERTFADQTQPYAVRPGVEEDGSQNPVVRRTHVVHPAANRWAIYRPAAPDDLFFDADHATFHKLTFDSVEAVGFLAQRAMRQGEPAARALTLKEPIALKFNAVQAVATVHLPLDHSPHVSLQRRNSGLLAADQPVSYAQWTRVWKWAVTNQRASRFPEQMSQREIGGYTFLSDGSLAETETGAEGPFQLSEPVTMLPWLDAVLWCNALSELEGLEPAYFSDAQFQNPLRTAANRASLEAFQQRPDVYWNSTANGYRLPLPDEAVEQSQVYEYLWPADLTHVPAAMKTVLASAGNLDPKPLTSRLPCGGTPFFEGGPELGFRVVRGTPQKNRSPVPLRLIARSEYLPPAAAFDLAELRSRVLSALPLVRSERAGYLRPTHDYKRDHKPPEDAALFYDLWIARSEVPYHVWNLVRHWAEANKGYQFNHRGDMGSLHYPLKQAQLASRSRREPVTRITWMDALVWCNALSELFDLEPAIVDVETGEVVRRSSPFRVNMYAPYRYPVVHVTHERPVDTAAIITLRVETERSGFRLPTAGEMERLIVGTERASRPAHFKTGPASAGQLLNGIYGLDGNVAEWTYGGDGLFGQILFGSDFGYPNGRTPHRMNQKEHPFAARYYLGFRPVRRDRSPTSSSASSLGSATSAAH